MWIRRRLREPQTLCLLLAFFLAVQAFSAAQFFKEGDAYRNYRMNSRHMILYAKAQRGNYSYFLYTDSLDPVQQDMKTWAKCGEEVSLYARDVFAGRYFQENPQGNKSLPINEDLHILMDLASLYGFDYQRYGVPRPEEMIGRQKWEKLRQYYHELGTPRDIAERLLPPYDRYLGERAGEAPVLLRQDPGYYFYMQKILHYVNIVLSDFPAMQFHAAPPAVLVSQLLGSRPILLLYIILCFFLTSTALAEDRARGTIRLLAARPRGRERYFLSAWGSGFLLAAGGMTAALLPGLVPAFLRFGGKGLAFPAIFLPYSYRHLAAFPLRRGEMASEGYGVFTRGRAKLLDPGNFEEMLGSVEIWKLLLAAFLFLFLLVSLMLLAGFLISALSRNRNITAAAAILPAGLAILSLYDDRFAAASFPYNPFAAMDFMATAAGMQDFTALAALLALTAWNALAFALALWVMRRRNLG